LCIALNKKLITELQSVTCHMESYTVLPDTDERAPLELVPDRLDLPTPKEWKTKLTFVLVVYLDGLPVCSHLSEK